ncbi:MAG: hypothetical protein JST16_08765 [Bdellovibrionales bacterium]|nr:hypothetical protein [Bdellovibrionales bacterium]
MKKPKASAAKPKIKVLYQYLNGDWYAFADLGNEIFFGKVSLQEKATGTIKALKPSRRNSSEAA